MSKASFRFSTNILQRLGEELNPSPDRGLIELVKNAYDADALKCTIELHNTLSSGGSVHVTDTGDGMKVDEIRQGWLVLGRSKKVRNEITKLGRIPAGDKGLGRLAALRLGSKVTLKTTPKDKPNIMNTLEIDWSLFDKATLVDDVILEIVKSETPTNQEYSTSILIENLHSKITRYDVKKLARAIILLADPFDDNPRGFKPKLKAPEFVDLENLVKKRYFYDSEFHLIAKVDHNGFASASVVDWSGKTLFEALHEDLRPKNKTLSYACPEAQFDIWAFILDAATFSTRSTTKTEVQAWLKEFGGVHLYYNGIRISPYGDEGNDWLGLNLMRVKSPEVRPSTNNSIGRVMINDTSINLIQKTDRSGFIESESFIELRQFAVDALNWMARRRLDEAEKKRARDRSEAKTKSSKAKNDIDETIETLPSKYRRIVGPSFANYDKTRDKEVKQLRKEVQLYRTLSTVGITSAVFAHESASNPIKIIAQSMKTVKTRCKKELGKIYSKLLEKPIERILDSIESLSVLSNVSLSLVDHEKRRLGRVDIHKVIEKTIELFQPIKDTRDTKIIAELDFGNPYLRGSKAAMESIITNLFNNSLVSFENMPPGDRKIIVKTEVYEKSLNIKVMDNGPGIEGISLKDIWLPGQTTRKNGTGLGLTIVKDAVSDLGGSVSAIVKGELGGAEIEINLPVLGN